MLLCLHHTLSETALVSDSSMTRERHENVIGSVMNGDETNLPLASFSRLHAENARDHHPVERSNDHEHASVDQITDHQCTRPSHAGCQLHHDAMEKECQHIATASMAGMAHGISPNFHPCDQR